jgi:hypothetical protein
LRASAEPALELRYRQVFTGAPSIEIYIQHVLLEARGIAADTNQQALLGGFGHDCTTAHQNTHLAM